MGIRDRSQSRNGKAVRLLAVHSTEGNGTAQALRDATWWTGSSHAIADERTLLTPAEGCVPYALASWTLRGGNPISDNIELVGWARWTRAEWLARPGLLEHCARWLADRSRARGIPLVKITAAQIKAGQSGVIGHVDWTLTGDGSHTDPGPGFPFDLVLARARALAAPRPEDDLPYTEADLTRIIREAVWVGHQIGARDDRTGALTGEVVSAEAFLATIPGRVQSALPAARVEVTGLDYDVLAQKVADLLATRLAD